MRQPPFHADSLTKERHKATVPPVQPSPAQPSREYSISLAQFSASFLSMLYTIVVVLVILWLLGFIGHIGGGLIHLLLVIAVIVLIFNFISGRR
jgi:hypothetical protein